MIKNYKVYIHTTPSGKKYVGMTCKQINARWQNGRGYKSSKYFYRAVLKYGWDNISHEIVLTNATLAEASEKEKELIIEYKSNNSKYGYNRTDGGEIGFKHSKATIEKLRILSTNISEETRKRRSKSATGRKMSKEAIEKSSRTHRKPVNQYA